MIGVALAISKLIVVRGGPAATWSQVGDVGGGSWSGLRRGTGAFYMSGKSGGAPRADLGASKCRRSQAQILSCHWLEEGTSAYLVMGTRHILLPLLKEAEIFSFALCFCFCFCFRVGVRFKVV